MYWKLPGTGNRKARVAVHGYRVSVWVDEKVLDIESGDGCETL